MKKKSIKIEVSEVGSVSGICAILSAPLSVLVLAPGAGAGIEHSFIETLASGLQNRESRRYASTSLLPKIKKGRPDSPAVDHMPLKDTIAKTWELFLKIPIYVAGK